VQHPNKQEAKSRPGQAILEGIEQKDKTMRKLLVLVVLAIFVCLMLLQFGPSVAFGSEPAGSSHVRAGTR
jgi:hypothetical protein